MTESGSLLFDRGMRDELETLSLRSLNPDDETVTANRSFKENQQENVLWLKRASGKNSGNLNKLWLLIWSSLIARVLY